MAQRQAAPGRPVTVASCASSRFSISPSTLKPRRSTKKDFILSQSAQLTAVWCWRTIRSVTDWVGWGMGFLRCVADSLPPRGGGLGRGDCRTSVAGIPPTPNPPHKGEGNPSAAHGIGQANEAVGDDVPCAVGLE